MGGLSPVHWLIVALIFVLLFGAKKLPEMARSLGQSLSGYLRDLMDADAAAETNAEVIARIARDREPVDLTMDDILAARDEGRR